ncbi:MAG TPA: YdeI/OmpD-associated family protein [Usitatibacteraceae bacterium]|nr:YdeI/OmpD-associated family protein [Usitatibacteraceae bacterium]
MPTFFKTPAAFRAWLTRHAATRRELLVGFYKRGSGRQSVTWSESVDEALCFGWIDGVRKKVDEESYTIRFSPRRPGSTWSAINIDKVRVLEAAGRMTPAGLEAFAHRNEDKSRIYAYEQAKRAEFCAENLATLRADKVAWAYFSAQPPSYRHLAAWYVESAKRPETRAARLAKVIAASARGVRI